MPTCRSCGKQHFNFQRCDEAKVSQPVHVQYRTDAPEGFHPSRRWGNNVNVPIIYQLPARQRTGSLIGPDGEPYVPEPLPPPEAA